VKKADAKVEQVDERKQMKKLEVLLNFHSLQFFVKTFFCLG
jgi:hypothetical protein